jgi:hypothetical protein
MRRSSEVNISLTYSEATKVKITFPSRRSRVYSVVSSYTDGSVLVEASANGATYYSCEADGMVYRQRYTTGQYAGDLLNSELIEGARWEVVAWER